MPAQVGRRLYNRFDVTAAAVQPDGNVVLQATDSVYNNLSVQILQWTPTAEPFPQCAQRFAAFGNEPDFEIFSEEQSLYAVMPVAAAPAEVLPRLWKEHLFLGSWPGVETPASQEQSRGGFEETRVGRPDRHRGTPEPGRISGPEPGRDTRPEPRAGTVPPAGPATRPEVSRPEPSREIEDRGGGGHVEAPRDNRPPERAPVSSRRLATWIVGAAVVAFALLVAGILGIDEYNKRLAAERERVRLEEQLRQQQEETERKEKEAAEKAKVAEEQAKKDAERIRQLETEKLAGSALNLEPTNLDAPIRMTSGPLNGLFWAALTKSTTLGQQRLLAFPTKEAAFEYLKNSEWMKGQMVITSITTASADQEGKTSRILVLLSENRAGWTQSYMVPDAFPHDWISKRRSEGFHITSVAKVGTSWWIVTSKNTDFREQVVIGPTPEWPAEAIKKEYDRPNIDMFITEIAHHDDQGFVVVMSSSTSGRLRNQKWYRGWNDNDIQARRKEGMRFTQALKVGETWYAVLTDTGEDATWQIDEKQFPRTGVLNLASQGYRIAWLW
jgi:hypothetical protein